MCSDLSDYSNDAGTTTGGLVSGAFTEPGVTEVIAVAGSGCLINNSIQSCTLVTSTNACEYAFVGGSFTTRDSTTGDLLFGFFNPGGSVCVDFSAFPFNFSFIESGTISGGTGKSAE
ncbi:MAG TPA: hypothetical protein VKS22_11160 [Candidatus Binataceae bacterium]|nr:hypothetical protein [Candidatus Binataceae bacterium]